MTNYTKTTDFAAKDSLPSGNAAKIVKGSEIDTEFNNIATASATKANANDAVLTGTTTAQTLDISGNVDVDGTLETDALSLNGVTVTSTAAELNYVDGVTSNIQTQLDTKAPLASPTFTGTVTVPGLTTTANVLFGDDDKAIFGAGSDLQIYHSSSAGASYIDDAGQGRLYVRGNRVTIQKYTDEPMLDLESDGAVTAYYNNAAKLATTATGIDVTGVITTDGMTTSADINFGDNNKAIFGASSDLEIYHHSTEGSFIKDVGTGDLILQGGNDVRVQDSNGTELTRFNEGAGVDIKHNGTTKLTTTSTGISVSGAVGAPSSENFYRIKLRDTGGIANDVGIGQPDADSLAFNFTPTSTGHIAFFSGSNEKVRIDANGRVGIGESSPATDLHITNSGATQLLLESGTSSQGILLFGDADDLNVGSVMYDHSDNSMRFETSDTERMRVDSSGQVGIGTDSGTAPLHILKAATGINAATDVLKLSSVDTNPAYYVGFQTQRDNSAGMGLNILTTNVSGTVSESLRIDASGNLLVGKTSVDNTTQGIRLYPTGRQSIVSEADNALILNRRTSDGAIVSFRKDAAAVGSITITSSATAYNTSSDQRLKENIADAPSASNDIDAIQVRSFDWKADGSHQKYGMVAQELQSVAPEAVTGDADSDEMMGVDYSKLVPMLVKEIQSLRNRVAQLENN